MAHYLLKQEQQAIMTRQATAQANGLHLKPVALWNCHLSGGSRQARNLQQQQQHTDVIRYLWRSASSQYTLKGASHASSASSNASSSLTKHAQIYALGYSSVKSWNTSGRLTFSLDAPQEFNGKLLSAIDEEDRMVYMGGNTNQLWLWDIEKAKFVVKHQDSMVMSGLGSDSVLGLPAMAGGPSPTSSAAHAYPNAQHGTSKMCTTSKFLVCARTDGSVQLRDKQSLKVLHEFPLHSGALNDIAVKDDLLISCGLSRRPNGLDYDRQLKCLDLRTMSLLPSISFMYDGPAFIRFHPTASNVLVIVGQNGYFQCKEVVHDMSVYPVHQIFPSKDYSSFSEPQHVVSFDISPSGEMFSFVDTSQRVHLWATNPQPKVAHPSVFQKKYHSFKEYSPDYSHTHLHMNDETPLSAVSTYEQDSVHNKSLFSDVDMNASIRRFSTLKQIHPKIVQHLAKPERGFFKGGNPPLKVSPNVQYAPNPGLLNAEEGYVLRSAQPALTGNVPALSNNSSNTTSSNNSSKSPSPTLSTANSTTTTAMNIPDADTYLIPKDYRFRSSTIDGWKEIDFAQFNQTPYTGLENSLENGSLFNSFVQTLYHIHAPLRHSIMSHSCEDSECITCQLGFLFDMMQKKQEHFKEKWCNMTCFPGNFMRILNRRLSRQERNEGSKLFDDKNHNDTPNVIHFLISTVSQELSRDENYPIPNKYPHVIPAQMQVLAQQSSTTEKKNLLELLLSSQLGIRHRCTKCFAERYHESKRMFYRISLSSPNCSFEQAIQNSISNSRVENIKRRCNHCDRLCPFENISKCVTLPNMLCFVFSDRGMDQLWLHRQFPKSNNGITCIPVQYNALGGGSSSNGKSVAPQLVLTWNADSQTYNVQAEYDEKSSETEVFDEENPQNNRIVYELHSFMCKIHHPLSNGRGHHVSFVRTNEESSTWHLFNDFTITKQKKHIYDFSASWKQANMLMYVRKEIQKASVKVDVSNHQLSVSRILRGAEPLPYKGQLVAIDAEFVQMKSCMELSLGRVSVLREDGSVLIDDHIGLGDTESVSDYLTRYSGLREGDLDHSHHHTVVELKTAYRKLKALVDEGVVFVGHGLKSDFKIINLVVPPDQIRDTVELFQLPNQRKIGLRFLAKTLLKEDVQQGEHDSVEDASTALKLFKMYQRLQMSDEFDATLDSVYQVGRETNWVVHDGVRG